MSSNNHNQYISFAVGKSGGSNGQPFEIKRSGRGLGNEQDEPLVLWWVRLLKPEYSADQVERSRQGSYRRSRWGHPAQRRVSPLSQFFAMHRNGRLFTAMAMALGLTASLNMVALADETSSISASPASGIPSAERFSMMKDFAGKHGQYLDLSKLSEFKWADEIHVASRRSGQKPQLNRFSATRENSIQAQPHMVRATKSYSSKNDRELTDRLAPAEKTTESESPSGSFCDQIEEIERN